MTEKKQAQIATPLGEITAIADESFLYSLSFTHSKLPLGRTEPIELIEKELSRYFSRELQVFQTPFALSGTPFQRLVWDALQTIPYGETRSYAQIALLIGKQTAYRAVAQANSANPLSILIPCHRVIYADRTLGGYSGGLDKKRFFLQLESVS